MSGVDSQHAGTGRLEYRPEIFIASNSSGYEQFEALSVQKSDIVIHDHLISQIRDLIKVRTPQETLTVEQLEVACEVYLKGRDPKKLGVWVYYPWRNTLVHLLPENEFIELRTSRNLYKITREEQNRLSAKTICMIGLSVGHTMAMNFALERSVGRLKLADFDDLELSNLNRIRTGLMSLGIPKVVAAAREVAEIDPFIDVEIFPDGISEENIEQFLSSPKPDILIEECDGLNIKILARQMARKLGIPVVMETSDRGMIDIERYDLDPEYPILHGMIDHLDISKVKNLKTSEEKIPFLMPMVGINTMSPRLKASAMEVGTTLTTWPQLGTSVMLGGAILADTCRRILLDQFRDSGRYILDPADILKPSIHRVDDEEIPRFSPLTEERMIQLVTSVEFPEHVDFKIPREDVVRIVEASGRAASGGNSQPWRWLLRNNCLYLFLDRSRSDSFMDYLHTASYISLGSCLENACIRAEYLGYEMNCHTHFGVINDELVACLEFKGKGEVKKELEELNMVIELRFTDRRNIEKKELSPDVLKKLQSLSSQYDTLDVKVFSAESAIEKIAEVVSISDRLRVLSSESHHDFTVREMRWTEKELNSKKDGIYVEELELNDSDLAGLYLIKDKEAVEFLRDQDLGKGLQRISSRLIKSASFLVAVYSNEFHTDRFMEAGRLLEQFWLYCTINNIGLQILNVPAAFLLRMKHSDFGDMSENFQKEVYKMDNLMSEVVPDYKNKSDILLFRVFGSLAPKPQSVRLDIKNILCFG